MLDTHFACFREYETIDEAANQRGRIDLLIETDDFVIGVENKFYAKFEDEQPNKYLKSLKENSQGLTQLRAKYLRHISGSNYMVVVLAPKRRRDEIKPVIKRNPHLTSLTWEEVPRLPVKVI